AGQARVQGCHGSRPCAVETAAGAEGDSLRLHRHVCAYHHTTQCLSAVCVRGGAAAVAVVVTVTCSVLFESVSLHRSWKRSTWPGQHGQHGQHES
ncbi:MAG: hypothetical protein ACK56I_19580, partial [bacterium]